MRRQPSSSSCSRPSTISMRSGQRSPLWGRYPSSRTSLASPGAWASTRRAAIWSKLWRGRPGTSANPPRTRSRSQRSSSSMPPLMRCSRRSARLRWSAAARSGSAGAAARWERAFRCPIHWLTQSGGSLSEKARRFAAGLGEQIERVLARDSARRTRAPKRRPLQVYRARIGSRRGPLILAPHNLVPPERRQPPARHCVGKLSEFGLANTPHPNPLPSRGEGVERAIASPLEGRGRAERG